MKCWKNGIVGIRGLSCVLAVGMWLGLCQLSYGAGTLAETATTLELQDELSDSSDKAAPKPQVRKPRADANRPAESNKPSEPNRHAEISPKPAPEANAVAGQQSTEKLEKVARKLMQSMRSGRYDQADFSAVWNTVVPKDTNFSDGINAMCKPIFEQFGKAEKLGQGTMAGPNRAVFPVQFTKGTLNMTISLDQQDKIVEWTLLIPPAVPPNGHAANEQSTAPVPSQETNVPDINDFNDFQRELKRINMGARGEERLWLGQTEQKTELARAIEELITAELRFIRKVAESENASETARAIDLVLAQRRERLEKLKTKLENEAKEDRQQQTGERRRTPRAGGQEQSSRERHTNPARGSRENSAD